VHERYTDRQTDLRLQKPERNVGINDALAVKAARRDAIAS